MVNPFLLGLIPIKKNAFWANESRYAGYREYTHDEFFKDLKIILFNIYMYIQFNGSIFKQILGKPIGGYASHLLPIYIHHAVNIAIWIK